MKRLNYISLLLGVVLIASSCKKSFLDLSPEGQLNENNFFLTTKDFQTAVVGAYVPLRDIASVEFYMDEMRSDNTHYDINPTDRGSVTTENLADFLDISSNGQTGARYQAAYRGIGRTNVILDRLETITFNMADADKNQIIGETKALRAHYYFDLVRHFGGVPLHIHEVTSIPEASLTRSSVDSVYQQIISDLTDALSKLKDPTFDGGGLQDGRITKGMVATELALVYMTRKEWDKAQPLLESVTSMGYDLLPDYAKVFDPANKNNRESIFEVQYRPNAGEGQWSMFVYRFMPIGNVKGIMGFSSDYNNSVGGWNIPTEDLIRQYEAGDKRLDISIGVVEVVPDPKFTTAAVKMASIINYTPTPGTTPKKVVKKYYHAPYPLPNRTTEYFGSENWPVYRFADVLLMLAETLNERGLSAAALPHLNRVRSRAGLGGVATTDQQALRDAIAKERRTELAFENKRWVDLIRTGKAVSVMTEHGKEMKQQYNYLNAASYNVTPERLVYPIPFREMQLNNKLVQNPGY